MKFQHLRKEFEINGVSNDDHIYKCITQSGTFYEVDLLEYMRALKPFLRRGNNRIAAADIGANIGNHSIYMASFIADRLISIEPNPAVLPILRDNLMRNSGNYSIYACAVGDKEGRGNIFVPKAMEGNIGAARIEESSAVGEIQISTLDSILEGWLEEDKHLCSISLIKLDVEGMEPMALKGAQNTIKAFKPHIFAEAATLSDLENIKSVLTPLGYKVMPGKWAATPVYHFAHQPSGSLLLACLFLRAKNIVRKIHSKVSAYKSKILLP